MTFKLRTDESVTEGIVSAAGKQMKRAGHELKKMSGEDKRNGDKAVHDVRKRFKRVRALLRLVRKPLGEKRYHRVNTLVRDAGKPLAELRDAEALVAALAKMEEMSHPPAGTTALEPVRRGLEANYQAIWQKLEDNGTRRKISALIGQARRKIRKWRISSHGSIRQGLTRTYEQGRQSYTAVTVDPSIANLHEWRKQVKYLLYQIKFLEPLRPRMLKALAQKLDRLADLLGDDHDLATLAEMARAKQESWHATEVCQQLSAAIHQRRERLQSRALKLGARVYDLPATEFVVHLTNRRRGDRTAAATG
jgi:CHAD domain-containing protein